MKVPIWSLLLASILWPSDLVVAQLSPEHKLGSLRFEPYSYQFEGRTVEAELGRLVVKENRRHPNSRLIELAFTRLKSTAPNPGAPVVYLDGGPGSSAIGIARYPEYMRAFMKLREVGDVILLDQRGVGLSRPNLTRISAEPLPLDFFAREADALNIIKERSREAVEYFRRQGVDLPAYNSIESANDIDDLRKALGVAKINLVGFSYGTHLALAAIRYHGDHLNRVALMGTEGPNHTQKLPSTSQKAIETLSKLIAQDPTVGAKVPDMAGLLKRILDRLEKEPATVRITDRRTNKPVDVKVGKFGVQIILMIDLGDTSDLPIFPALLYTIDRGDYSILARFVERRYNQIGAGVPVMMEVMDSSSGATRDRIAQIKREARNALLGNVMNFLDVGDVFGNPDLGDEYRSPIHTSVPTLFFSGTLDSSCPPFQADEVRKYFRNSVHIIVGNAGHEDMVTNPQVQQAVVDYFRGRDVSQQRIELPPVRFLPIPETSVAAPR
ncbi:MAG TPA: alpha/beta fold hydrolase [Blastocatellia bacterium]|nr:alpha/beta fold hydrolase [Blastocatellia bacterium]